MDPSEKRMKFSAFARREREYSVDKRAEMQKKMQVVDKPFEPKPEFSRIEFDPNIRQRMDEFDNTLLYRAFQWREPDVEPQSTYVAV